MPFVESIFSARGQFCVGDPREHRLGAVGACCLRVGLLRKDLRSVPTAWALQKVCHCVCVCVCEERREMYVEVCVCVCESVR